VPESDSRSVDVLVVDDEPAVASSTADILRSAGLNAATTSTVKEALAMVESRDVRSIILDHQLADNGEKIFEGVRVLPPIIVMSGIGREALAALQVLHGDRLFACMAKPVPPLRLIDVVKSAIETD